MSMDCGGFNQLQNITKSRILDPQDMLVSFRHKGSLNLISPVLLLSADVVVIEDRCGIKKSLLFIKNMTVEEH